jgi:hypothetical protein
VTHYIQPDTYRARAIGAALGSTSQGKPQIGVEFQILDGGRAGDDSAVGKSITWYGSFASEKAIEITMKALRICGWQGDDLDDLTTIDANEVAIVVEEDQDLQGNPQIRVRWVNALGGGGIAMKNRMDETAARAFAAEMRGYAIQSRGAAPPARPAAPRAPAPAAPAAPRAPAPQRRPTNAAVGAGTAVVDDDNIPF